MRNCAVQRMSSHILWEMSGERDELSGSSKATGVKEWQMFFEQLLLLLSSRVDG